MSLHALWAFLAIALPVLGTLLAGLSTVDLAYHLRAGGQLLDTGAIPLTDTFTFTAQGRPWVNQQWGAQALLAATFRAAGWTGLVVLRAALVGAIAALVFLTVRRQGPAVRPAALLTIAAFSLASVAMALRPQLIGMVLFALVLLLVVERRRHPVLLWLVPPVALVWANVHGSFFLAPAVVGLAWLADLHDRVSRPHRTLLVAGASALAACVTPFGPSVWVYAAGLTANPLVTERITEWQPTTVRSPAGIAFYASVLLIAAALARRRRATPWPALLWFGAFFLVGAWAVRGAAWWPIAAAVGFAGVIGSGFLGAGAPAPGTASDALDHGADPDGPRRGRRSPMRAANAAIATLIVVSGIALLPVWRPTDAATGAPAGVLGQAPAGITAALRDTAAPGDRVYLPQIWGSWIELAVPEATVVLDSRIELFPAEVWDAYVSVAEGRVGWPDQLEAWGVTIVVASDEQTEGLLDAIPHDAGWRQQYRDEDGTVLVRADRRP